jgi:hypothetical protein
MNRLTEWDKTHKHGQLVKGDGYTRLAEYEDTGLTPEGIKDHEEIFSSYRHICGGRSPEDIKKALELLDAEEKGLLIRIDCTGCIKNNLSECMGENCIRWVCNTMENRDYPLKDYYEPEAAEEALKGGAS